MSEKFVRVFNSKDSRDYRLGRSTMRTDVQEILETERLDLERMLQELKDNPPDHFNDLETQQEYHDDTVRLEAKSELLQSIGQSIFELTGLPTKR